MTIFLTLSEHQQNVSALKRKALTSPNLIFTDLHQSHFIDEEIEQGNDFARVANKMRGEHGLAPKPHRKVLLSVGFETETAR